MESLWEGGSYTGELVLCLESVPQARDEHMPQTSIELVLQYIIMLVAHNPSETPRTPSGIHVEFLSLQPLFPPKPFD